ncbi:MAG: ABC transporter permease, partial [Pseudomonadota bacterium]
MNTRLGVPSLILGEALEEFKRGIKGWLVPSIFVLLTIYMILVLLNADYMREMGAVGIQRNSAHLTYLMASGQSLWIFFTWAWVFAQVIMRDRTAIMHEVVYATPVSLRGLLVGRYLGALGLGIVMASAIFVGLIISPALASAGVFPKGAIGPIQWGSFLWAYLIFIIPTAAGSGALYLSATIKARDTKGAFICAALLSFIWMVGMIVLKSGDVNPWLASVIDPTAYAEAERQADSWTPAQKIGGYIELTPQLILNRLIWAGLPLFIFAFTLWKVTRESLVLEKAEKSDNKTLQPQMTSANSIGPLTKASSLIAWMRITLSESAWHTRLLLGGFGFKLAAVMLILTGALGSYVNFVQHVVGPKTAVPEGLMPFLTEFFYLILIFVMVGFLGLLFRRDEKQGFDEWVDTVPAPMGSIIIAKALSGILLIAMLCAIPALSSIFLTLLTQSDAFDVAYPFTYMFSVVFPSMLELGAFIFFLHALIRSPGLAYTVSIFVAFIAIVNHELMVVEYPPGQFAVPPHAEISNIAGWSTWLASLSWMALLKTSTALLLFSLAWLAWRRGTAATLLTRSQEFVKRLIGAPGIVACLGVLLMVISITTLSFRFIEEGDYESTG